MSWLERVTIKVNYWNESSKVVKESWRFHHWMDTSFADIFGAVQDKIQEASSESLLFSFKGELVSESDTPTGVGMTPGETHILECFDRIVVKIEHRSRDIITIECIPSASFVDILSTYSDLANFDVYDGDLVTFKYDGHHVVGESKLSMFQKRDLTLVAYTFTNRFNWRHEIDAFLGTYSSPIPTPEAATMMQWLAPPGTSIPSWRSEVTKMEALRLGRIIEHWPHPPKQAKDHIALTVMRRFMDWAKALPMRTAVRDDCALIFRKPITAEATSRFRSSCLDQQNEELDALHEGWEQWRADLIEDWERQQSRFLHGCHALPSLQRALHNNTVARLQREARIVFVLGELTRAWESTSFLEQDLRLNRDLITLQNKAKGLSLAVLIEEWKRERKGTTDASAPRKPRTLRDEIQRRWNKASRNAGAAGIEFINEIDEEEVPPNVGILFSYLEKSYRFEAGVNPKKTPPIGCKCEGRVDCAECLCHGEGGRIRKKKVHSVFEVDMIVECNAECLCSAHCGNRVSQRPRQFSVQIFKTDERGWGARATMNIMKGSMVGIYTGLILRRKDAASLPNFRLSYCFDLDAMENFRAKQDNSYTVDAFSCGNWTRFINHSCQPNLRIMPVVSDTVPEDNLFYLAFVATEDISAYSELTVDYNPKHQLEWERKKFSEKGSVRKKRGKTEARCRCRAEKCRGWLPVPEA